ncbi:hypothetical protein PIECOFPK_02538 [Mycovorax composti]|jgi:Uncharacterized conserved protein|uniref:Type VI secretion protein n=2 Tax=Chitinophagaceae TaxID=563835 RepID=A0ABZ2ENG7_9BACT
MGQPAARVGDMHVCPVVNGVVPHVGGPVLPAGVPTVLIQGLPAATMGTMCACTGPPDVIIRGSGTVLIGGMPAARMGDTTAHGGTIVQGCFTVLIGDTGSGGGGGGGAAAPGAFDPSTVGKMGAQQAQKVANSQSLQKAAEDGSDNAARTKREDFSAKFSLVDEANRPMEGVRYEIETPDGQIHEGKTNSNGETETISGYTKADCRVRFKR